MRTESITVHATHMDIRQPSAHLRALLYANDIAADMIDGCELALHEHLVNLVDHAYEGDGNKLITVTITCNSNTIKIETQDTGKPLTGKLDEMRMPDPSELAEGGYGMAIIQTLMDEVKYKADHGTNIWILIKNI